MSVSERVAWHTIRVTRLPKCLSLQSGVSSMAAIERCHRRIRLTRRSGSGGSPGGLPAATLALVSFTCLLLLWTSGVRPLTAPPSRAVEVHADLQVRLGPKATPTVTASVKPSPTPTSTAPVTPPTIQLVSPASGQGPVGAHLTVQGTRFTGNQVHLFGSKGPDCGASSGTLTTAAVTSGKISVSFIWPVSFPVGTYYICADGMTRSTAAYEVLTSSPPVLSLSALSVQMGQPLTIQGVNFAGAAAGTAVTLTETASGAGEGGTRTLPVNGALDGSGNFSMTWMVDGSYTGAITIKAHAESKGSAPAVLQASTMVTIQAAATATAVSATPSASAASGTGTISTTSGGSGNSTGAALLIIFLITGIILTMLVIVGLVIFLTMHRRGAGRYSSSERGPATGYAAYSGYPDYGQYNAPPAGQVAEWDEDPDSQPGPNWRPRPMTGYYPRFDSGPAAPPPGSASGWGRSRQVPEDPWNDPEEGVPDPANDQWPDLGGSGGGSGSGFWP